MTSQELLQWCEKISLASAEHLRQCTSATRLALWACVDEWTETIEPFHEKMKKEVPHVIIVDPCKHGPVLSNKIPTREDYETIMGRKIDER